MGSIKRRTVTNIFQVPKDIFFNFLGKGFFVRREGESPIIEITPGGGLIINDLGQIAVDDTVDPTLSKSLQVCSNVSISVEGRKLVLKKILSRYEIQKNQDGFIIDFKLISEEEIREEQLLLDYGYNSAVARPLREHTEEFPNFYK